jgi:hypothetical protein
MSGHSLLGGVPAILNAEQRAGEVSAVLALVDQELDGRLDEPMWVTVPDVGRILAELVNREHKASTAAKAVAHRQRLADLAGSLLDDRGEFTAAEFEERLQAHCDSIHLLAEIGEIERAAELLNVAAGYLRPMDTDLEPQLRAYAADLMWTAADAFGVNEWFLVALDHQAAAAQALGDDGSDAHLMVAARCLDLIGNGTYPMRELLVRAAEALQAVNANRRLDPAVMALRFALARRTGDRSELAKVAAAGSGLDERSQAIAQLLGRLHDAAAWQSEFGPFGPFIYAECAEVSHDEAMDIFEFPVPDAASVPGTAAVRIGSLTLAEPGCDPPAAMLALWIHAVPADEDLTTTAEGRRRRRRSIPTAAMHTAVAALHRPDCPAGVRGIVRIGRAAAATTMDTQIDAMLGFFDGGEETDAVYPCAGLLVGIVLQTLGEQHLLAYVEHLELADSHAQAVDRCRRQVPLAPRQI